MNDNKRLTWIDVARGIAMLLIIAGHCGPTGTLWQVIHSFHVPLFFLLSGLCFSENKCSLKKDCIRLLVPYGVVVCLVVLFCYINNQVWGGLIYYPTYKDIAKAAIYGFGTNKDSVYLIGAIWFLPTIFIARRLLKAILDLPLENELLRGGIVTGVVFFGSTISTRVWVPMNVDIAMVAMGFMYVGWLMKRINVQMNINSCLCMFMVWLATFYAGPFAVCDRTYQPIAIFAIGAICGSVLIMNASIYLTKVPVLGTVISFIGRHTMLLLCINDLDWRMPYSFVGLLLNHLPQLDNPFWMTLLARGSFDILVMCIIVFFMNIYKKMVTK